MIPYWLHGVAVVSLVAGLLSAVFVVRDEIRHPQPMAIMNAVWPLMALSGGPLLVWLYRRKRGADKARDFPFAVAAATCHCGAGCTLGDLIAETSAFLAPGILVWFGQGRLFDQSTFLSKVGAVWTLDFVAAFLCGIGFQYFAIAPMRRLGFWQTLVAALKVDALSLIAWQVGMYGAMAIGQFAFARPQLGAMLTPAMAEFWFLMQIAMLAGFATSYPVNWILLRTGIKERM